MRKIYDVCIIGGGAAGIAAAIAAGERGCRVCILEKNKKIGQKLYATGNGRCNLANTDNRFGHFHSSSADKERFLSACLGAETEIFSSMSHFLEENNIYLRIEKDCYAYPQSMQASAVVWAFTDRLNRLSVDIFLKQQVREVCPEAGGGYRVCTEADEICARQVILACGGRSYAALGGSGLGYDLCGSLRIPLVSRRPSLCGLVTEEDTEVIKGVRVTAEAWIAGGGGQNPQSAKPGIAGSGGQNRQHAETDITGNGGQYRQRGELQITEYGLSGIMIFNLSSQAGALLANGQAVTVMVDVLPDISEALFLQGLSVDGRSVYGSLNAFLPDKLALYILQKLEIPKNYPAVELPPEMRARLFHVCRNLEFPITGWKGYEQAQVTAGGIRLDAVDPATMEVKEHPGLYAAGEMLDIDGDCGGYNLTFAILTGRRAGGNCHASN